MILETRHLQLILAVTEHGTLTQAARHLHLTQSALSHQLLQLEGRVRLPLFHRLRRRMVPTVACERLLETARRVVPELVGAEEALRAQVSGRTAVIRLAIERYTSYHWLPAVLMPFHTAYPGVDVQIVAEATGNPTAALLSASIDLGIIPAEDRDPRLRYFSLFHDEVVLVIPPWHGLGWRPWVRAADLASEHLITHWPPDTCSVVRTFLAQDRVTPKRVSEIRLTEALIEMVKAGMGVGILSRWAVQPHLDAGTLRAARLGRGGLIREWNAVVLHDTPPLYLRKFLDMIAASPSVLSSRIAVQGKALEGRAAAGGHRGMRRT